MGALDERKITVLEAVVRGYVRHGEPVGSKRVAEESDLGVSPATIRAEMGALEEAGLITQPHTSAGRVPTDAGYRLYVDRMAREATPTPQQQAAVERHLLGSADAEQLLRRSSQVLSRLTRFAALVASPSPAGTRVRHVELVRLGGQHVLAVVIGQTGRVDKRTLELDGEPVDEHTLQRARWAVNEAVSGLSLHAAAEVTGGLAAGCTDDLRPLVQALSAALEPADTGDRELFLGGTANIATGFEQPGQVRAVYEAVEEQVVALQLLREALAGGDPAVRIGRELPIGDVAPAAVVAAGYDAGEGATGSLGVLGPTRMDYPRTLAAVQTVASSLEKALAQLDADHGPPSSRA